MRQLSVSVLVKLDESSSKLCDLRLGDSGGDVGEGALPKFGVAHVVLHVLDHLRVEIDQVVLLISLALDPWVLKRLLGCHSHICRSFKKFADHIFGFR